MLKFPHNKHKEVTMPWTQVQPTDEKMHFVIDWLEGFYFFNDLCGRYGVSRPTGYKLVQRFITEGSEAFEKLSKRPHTSPNQTAKGIEEVIVQLRLKRPSWGPKKILAWLSSHGKLDHTKPARSTVCEILKRNGCIEPKRRRPHRSHPGKPITVAKKPNDIWTADFKGKFKTLNGKYCYPLTVADSYSRYLLECQGMTSPRLKSTKETFLKLFKKYGLPRRIRTDNGTPFASNALGRLTKLTVWFIRLGINTELIEPSSPQQNGAHERMHRVLKQEATLSPGATCKTQQKKFDSFIHDYNFERPHEALNDKTPNSLYHASPRKMPDKLPALKYPSHFEFRLVSMNGGFRWKSKRIPAGQVFSNEYLGLEEIDDGIWNVYYGCKYIGRFDEKIGLIEDNKGNLTRKKV